MSLLDVANRMGTGPLTLDRLLTGEVSPELASHFGASALAVQDFIDGKVSTSFANATDIRDTSLQELRDQIGREGAIGFVLGMCIAKSLR